MAKKKRDIDFEYCECGCHGFSLSIAGQNFWVLDDLKGHLRLHSGHGWLSPKLAVFENWKEVEAFVRGKLKALAEELKGF